MSILGEIISINHSQRERSSQSKGPVGGENDFQSLMGKFCDNTELFLFLKPICRSNSEITLVVQFIYRNNSCFCLVFGE